MSARVRQPPRVRRALQDEVYDAVLSMLLAGEIAPGTPVGIESLAMRLGVSPTPVREALARLAGTALIERSAMRGYRVTPPMDAAAVREFFEARVLVEIAAAKRAYAQRDTVVPALSRAAVTHADLVTVLTGPQTPPPGTDRAMLIRRCLEADLAFHRVIAQHCDNRYLRDLADRLGATPLRLTRLTSLAPAAAACAVAEHHRITTAFAEGTREEVQDAVRRHALAARDRIIAEVGHRAVPPDRDRRSLARPSTVRKTDRHE
ncbi:MAG: GntR family transcriptional regulator [Austwickia sp.]|nr:GntR family transcriptional regulator [Actinomycetota bacterium]MCO5309895.1 GntR family transcriptional regulator [Austwickia sp.]